MADPPILALSSRAKEQDALLASWSGVGERIQRVVCRTSHAKFTSGSMGSVSFAPSGLGVSSLCGTHGWRRGLHSCAASRLLLHGTLRLAAFFRPSGLVFLPCVVPTAWRRGLHSCAASRLLSHGTFRLAAFFRPLGAGCFILVWYPRLAPWAAFLRRFAAAVARNAPLGRGWTRHCERDL